MVQVLGSVLILISALFAAASALLYGLRFRWWQHSSGRHLFSYMAVIGAALALWTGLLISRGQFTTSALNEGGLWPYARLTVFAAIAWVLGWRLVIIVGAVQEQIHERRRSGDREDRGGPDR